MIGVINYGIGNIGSILNMFKKIGIEAKAVESISEVELSDKLVLPGVGSFDVGMRKLHESGLVEAIKKHALIDNKPLIGICLGMQMLGLGSEEGTELGLGFIPFISKKFDFGQNSKLKIPHMGWDVISNYDNDDPVVSTLNKNQRYYFVHSYYAVCENKANELMTCDYGITFAAAVKSNNIYGFQFHPEKSHKFGMDLLSNFSEKV